MRLLSIVVLILCTSAAFGVSDERGSDIPLYGTMDAGTRVFRFRIETTANAEGSVAHQLVSLDEGDQAFRLDNFQLDDKTLRFELKQTKAVYVGQVSNNGNTVKGHWQQAGLEFDLDFQRTKVSEIKKTSEIWSGTLNALFQKLQIRIRVYRNDDGAESVFFDSVSQKAGGFKAVRTIDPPNWTIKVDGISGSFEGVANEDNSEVTGTWTQGGIKLGLKLTPGLSEVVETVEAPKRPQTPVAPFPYLVEEVSIRNEVDSVTLAGTLTMPITGAPFPAVVMISGSGPQDRDESLLDHKPFWVIADYLSRNGVAVLRFDDRGTGDSTGDISDATSEDFAKDVDAAYELLRRDSRILPEAIGLVGHSEGGLIAPMVAVKNPKVAFIVLMAGTGVNGKEILLSQGQLILKSRGVEDASLLATQRATQLAMIETVLESAQDVTQEALVDEAVRKLTEVLPAESIDEASLRESVAGGIQRLQSPWLRYFLTHEPGISLQQVKCPVLAINGEKDVQVDPKLNLPAIRSALEKGGNSRFRIVEFPGLNHLFQTCKTGGLDEYQSIEQTIAPEVLQAMSDWIRDVTKSN